MDAKVVPVDNTPEEVVGSTPEAPVQDGAAVAAVAWNQTKYVGRMSLGPYRIHYPTCCKQLGPTYRECIEAAQQAGAASIDDTVKRRCACSRDSPNPPTV